MVAGLKWVKNRRASSDHGSVYENSRTDDSGEVEDITHMLPGQEQAFCFLIAQHELVKASQEQACGKLTSRQTVIDVEIGLAIQRGFYDWKLLQPGLDLGLGCSEEVGGIFYGGGTEVGEKPPCQLHGCS